MIKQLSFAVLVTALISGCGGSSGNNDSQSSSSTPAPASSAASSSEAPASSVASSSESSAASSLPSADLSYGFEGSIEGWFVNGSAPDVTVTPELELTHDQINSALSIKPLTWVGDNWKRQARIELPTVTDFTGATVTVVIDIPQSYITDGSFVLQLVAQGSGYTDSWNAVTSLVAGENTIVWNPAPEDPAAATGATQFGIQLSTAPSDTEILDTILVKSVHIELAQGGGASSSTAASSAGNVWTYTFAADTEGWTQDYGSELTVTHNADAAAAEITPNWEEGDQKVIKLIDSTDFTGAVINYVYTLSQAQVDAGITVQGYVQTGAPSYAPIYGPVETPVAGENTLTYEPQDSGTNIQIIERIGLQLNGPVSGAAASDTVLLNSVTVTLAP